MIKKYSLLTVLLVLIIFSSCSKDDNEVVNTSPIINAQTFSVAENINDTFVIGKVVATDAENDKLSFSIKTDTSNTFEITREGNISLLANKTLDYETTKSYTITVLVSDGTNQSTANITITVTNIDENTAPVINAQTFTVAENINDTFEIGAILATDAEANTLNFSITTNDAGLFEITNDGKLSLANGKTLDFETKTTHTITVEVTDGSLTANSTITINVTDVVEVPTAGAFITTWETTSANEEIKINARTNYAYDYTIDWGDGTVEANQTGTKTHTYATAGVYTVKIVGTFPTMVNPGAKLKSIEQWGTQEWETMQHFFNTATELVYNATDVPNLSKVTSTGSMFSGAVKFNADLSNWDVSNVTNMSGMFRNAIKFNGNISNWDVSKVTNISSMFWKAEKFNGDISNWNVSNATNMSHMFREAVSFNQNISAWNVGKVTNMEAMFRQTTSFNQPLNTWNVGNVTTMKEMFVLTENFNLPLNNWDVSKVTDMSSMFNNAIAFNQDLNNWNVSKVTNMNSMFHSATNFNGNISNWNVSNIVAMSSMFSKAEKFNQDLNNWNVGNVTGMGSMFSNAKTFNGNISNWNVSNVLTTERMFQGATDFNQPLNNWNVSKVMNMRFMFFDATNFNQDLNNWDVSSVTNMSSMFNLAENFNGNIDSWNVSKLVNMSNMFRVTRNFNRNIGNWDVSNVTNMDGVFAGASVFNRDISNWDVSNVTNMKFLFFGATNFSQNLSTWNISKVTLMNNMFDNSAMSTDKNYTKTLIGWSKLSTVPSGITLGANNVTYCTNYSADAATARDFLINTKGWTITQDTVSNTCN